MSTQKYEELLQLQDRIAGYIQAIDFLHGQTVITQREGDLDNRIKTALTKLGLAITVVTPQLQPVRNAGNRRFVFRVQIVVDVSENAVLNRSKAGVPQAQGAALAIFGNLVGKPNGLKEDPFRGESYELNPDPEDVMPLVPDKTALIYHVRLWTHLFITIPA